MIDALIRWSLRNRSAVLAMAALLLGWGGFVAAGLPVDVLPDVTAPTVTILTEAHGMAPVEVETQVTFPIEAALNGAPGVRRVRSATAVGISVVWTEFDWGTDLRTARQVVAERLSLLAGSLPAEAEPPVLAPASSVMGEILFLSLASDRHDAMALRTASETLVRRRLLAVPGVSQVTPIGGDERQYQVVLDPALLHARGVTLDQVVSALQASNRNVSAGFIPEGGSEYLVTGLGRVRVPEEIAQTVVATVEGAPVLVGQIGEVRLGGAPKRGEGSANGRPAVLLGILKQPGANTLTLTRELDRVLDQLAGQLPQGMAIDRRLFRQADFIEVAVHNVLAALRDGGILVIAIVVLFLGNLRASLITLLAIPLSLVVSALALQAFGATLNTMTLGGMAIAIGALVDDAIIDVENVFRRLRGNTALPAGRRRPSGEVVYAASSEIRGSIVFATLIILLVFLPLFFLPGVEGRLLQPLGLAYVVALGASLVVALTVTPALCALLLPESRAVASGREPRIVHRMKSLYAPILGGCLRRPWAVVLPGLLLLAASLGALPFMGRAFLPEFNEGALTISAVTLPGTSLAESDALARVAEETLLSLPEVRSVGRRTGRAELDEHVQGVESSEMDVSFVLGERSREAFLEALRGALSVVPGMNVTIGQPISHRIDHLLSGTRASVAIKIFGPDLRRLRDIAGKARRAAEDVEGVVDLTVEQQADVPLLSVRYNREAMASHGLRPDDLSLALEAALQGRKVGSVLQEGIAHDMVVRLSGKDPWRCDTLGDLPVETPLGARIPFGEVASLIKDVGPNTISRENVERKIVVGCNVAGRDVGSVVGALRARVDPLLAALPGYRVEYGGQFEAAEAAGRRLLLLGLAVVGGIAFLLYGALGSWRDTLFVMLNLPLALIGGIGGVFLSGGVLSVASLIGFITVFGIAARNGIMLVSHIRHLQLREGVSDFREAVSRGALERLAPILMTALAAGLALIPLVLAGGKPGNEIQAPMATVILCGILSSTLLNMLVVPALYLRFGRPAIPEGGKP